MKSWSLIYKGYSAPHGRAHGFCREGSWFFFHRAAFEQRFVIAQSTAEIQSDSRCQGSDSDEVIVKPLHASGRAKGVIGFIEVHFSLGASPVQSEVSEERFLKDLVKKPSVFIGFPFKMYGLI